MNLKLRLRYPRTLARLIQIANYLLDRAMRGAVRAAFDKLRFGPRRIKLRGRR